jgi:photosystem II stability/assembly factor-like uncharacterized protein
VNAARAILACYSKGLERAEEAPDGSWVVRKLLADLEVTCLAADPSNSNVVYAGTKQNGVYRSEDRGLSWSPAGMKGQVVKSLAVNPHDPEILYAGSKPALLFRSGDSGSTWEELDGFRKIPNRWWWFSPAEPPDRRPYVIAIAPSPSDKDTLLAGVEFGAVVRSTDGGQSWSRHLRGSLRDCHSLKYHHVNGDWAYEAGGSGGGASASKDGGVIWEKAGRGLTASYGIVCAADPVKPEVWYVCVGKSPFNAFGDDPDVYLYRSSGGAGWEPIGWSSHPLNETPTTLVTIPGKTGELYAGLKNGEVCHTLDYGDSWQRLPFKLEGIWHSMLVLTND